MTKDKMWIREWKPAFGFEKTHLISNDGIVKKIKTGKILKQQFNNNGYRVLSFRDKTRSKTMAVHRVVLQSFVGICPENHQASHLDGNRTNNRVDNLKWETAAQNNQRKILHGTQRRGENSGCVKLTSKLVLQIRKERAKGFKYIELSKKYKISIRHLIDIVAKKYWTHI